jgi:hypothetical protein
MIGRAQAIFFTEENVSENSANFLGLWRGPRL